MGICYQYMKNISEVETSLIFLESGIEERQGNKYE